jgi:hypothetical protein
VRIGPLLCSTLLLMQATCDRPTAVRGANLYVVTCEAEVYKFDTRVRRVVEQYDLATRAGTSSLLPVVPGPIEVCLVYGGTFDPQASVFYALVPAQGKQTVDPIRYTLGGFSVPTMSVVSRVDAGAWQAHPPCLVRRGGAPPQVVQEAECTMPSEPLKAFAPTYRDDHNTILARSGSRALVGVMAPGHQFVAVADESTKTLVPIQDVTLATQAYVHLAPGGSHVLVEDTVLNGAERTTTGTIHLYSATTGLVIKTISDDRIRAFSFLGMSPDGMALYLSKDGPSFLDLGMKFGPEQVDVLSLEDFPPATVFFSDR